MANEFSEGTIHKTNCYGEVKVLSYNSSLDIDVVFVHTGYKINVTADRIRKGTIKDKLSRSQFGIGYLGTGEYVAAINGKNTKAYDTWAAMIGRCYNPAVQLVRPTYIDCVVCDEWHDFSVFYKWFCENNIKGYELDKDKAVNGNKLYSPDTCTFISQEENKQLAFANEYEVTNKDGRVVIVKNMAKFCRDNNLHPSGLTRVKSGKRKSCQGWVKVVKLN